jgi:hypothetical protein
VAARGHIRRRHREFPVVAGPREALEARGAALDAWCMFAAADEGRQRQSYGGYSVGATQGFGDPGQVKAPSGVMTCTPASDGSTTR